MDGGMDGRTRRATHSVSMAVAACVRVCGWRVRVLYVRGLCNPLLPRLLLSLVPLLLRALRGSRPRAPAGTQSILRSPTQLQQPCSRLSPPPSSCHPPRLAFLGDTGPPTWSGPPRTPPAPAWPQPPGPILTALGTRPGAEQGCCSWRKDQGWRRRSGFHLVLTPL